MGLALGRFLTFLSAHSGRVLCVLTEPLSGVSTYGTLRQNSEITFFYGHSANENVVHIYKAIFRSKAKHLYFGVHRPDDKRVKRLDGSLAKYQRTVGSIMEYTLFCRESAKVWESDLNSEGPKTI
jgi:hypothetical protein